MTTKYPNWGALAILGVSASVIIGMGSIATEALIATCMIGVVLSFMIPVNHKKRR